MDPSRSSSGNGEDNLGIPDDLRCKRSDGKQWRCTARSMPDKTVCEKHYIQAKKRAANSALRASIKKANRKSSRETDIYFESKMEMDDFDTPLKSKTGGDSSLPVSRKKYKKNQFQHSPEITPTRSLSLHNFTRAGVDSDGDTEDSKEDLRQRTATHATGNSSKKRSQRSFDASPMTEDSDGSMDSSEDAGGLTCHQCQSNYGDRIIWCLKCDRRGYCDSCISQCYSNIPLEDLQKACPACRGVCNCKVCLRADILIKTKIREIPVFDKLQYLYSLLSSVQPVIKQIHNEQCSEVELEKVILGAEISLARAKLNEDEQMCCNICRTPIIDYHRRCANCMYDLCLHCCQDLREASEEEVETPLGNENGINQSTEHASDPLKGSNLRINLTERFPDWKAGIDGTIPCPPRNYGGCGYQALNLSRIFKMNWVAKLVKNVEEMVNGCKVNDAPEKLTDEIDHSPLEQYAYREDGDNTLYCPTSEDLKTGGIGMFREHWSKGEPIVVKQVWDSSCILSWDPLVIWRGIQETAEERKQGDNRKVKAVDCLTNSEVDIELEQFIKGYSEGCIQSNGLPELLKLKDWPSPSASEEFLMYQRTEFITKFPLLEYIHSKWGVLNVAAKLPHYSLQNDVGPKISISYGTKDELDRGDSVNNLHYKMRDMVYLLAHTCDANHECKSNEETWNSGGHSNRKELAGDAVRGSSEESLPDFHLNGHDAREGGNGYLAANELETMNNKESESNANGENTDSAPSGVLWDVFRRQDVPKLIVYLQKYHEEFGKPDSLNCIVEHPLFDEAIYLRSQHKKELKEEFGIEPWTIEQRVGQAVFIPAGCPFQMRNLQSAVLVALDFLSPESLGEAARLAQQVRCLPNDHEAKLQTVEVGKISLYAASSAIKEVQKLVLDPKFSTELGFEDPNLTAVVSENLERMTKRKQIACS